MTDTGGGQELPATSATGWALLPLRLFLGITFVFAGVQKLADPAFFRPSDPGSIQAQLHLGALGSPIRPLLDVAAHAPVLVGVALALGQLAVGLGALLGLGARLAAIGGMVISAALFLTVSFHDSPYYLGSDIVFLFAWTPLALVGTGGVWSLDARWSPTLRRHLARSAQSAEPAEPAVGGPSPASGAGIPATRPIGRRAFLGRARPVALVVAVGLMAAGLAEWLGGRPSGRPGGAAPRPRVAQPIARAGAVPPGTALAFTDSATGDPAYLVAPRPGQLVAFDAICPHAHCPVGYVAGAQEFVCPCHGSRFDASTGAVLEGPATVGLTRIRLTQAPNGHIYAGGKMPQS